MEKQVLKENRLPLKTKPSKWIPQLCLKYCTITVLVHPWHEKDTEYLSKMASKHLFWCKDTGHHIICREQWNRPDGNQAMNMRKKRGKVFMLESIYTIGLYQPMSWTPFYLITTNISENLLSPPQVIIFFHFLKFYLFVKIFLITSPFWVNLVLKKKELKKQSY